MPAVAYKANDFLAEDSPDPNRHIDMFFTRNGFDGRTRDECDKYARLRFPNIDMEPSKPQGYCSYTLTLSDGYLLQFRPETFKLDMDTCSEAKAIFGKFAPATTYMGVVQGILAEHEDGVIGSPVLHVYLQEIIPGIPLSEFRRRKDESGGDSRAFRRRVVEDLVHVFALSFHKRRLQGAEETGLEGIQRGKIGNSLRWRLDLLKGLPGGSLPKHVSEIQQHLDSIERSPWCLTHGDLLPVNIMVDPSSGHLTGLIDWAEAEWLPFGMGLYGIEEVLGHDVPLQGFQYYEDHQELRCLFWKRFIHVSRHRDFGARPWLEEIELTRRLGILLWRGIAFDDGRIDRVVEAGRDDSELQRLELFLEAPSPIEGLGNDLTCGSWYKRFHLAVTGVWDWIGIRLAKTQGGEQSAASLLVINNDGKGD